MEGLARRQLLPYFNNDPQQPVPTIDPHVDVGDNNIHKPNPKNHSGVYGSAAVHYGLGKLFVGIGGWIDEGTGTSGIDSNYTAFVRALDWSTLNDAWQIYVGVDGITRYGIPLPEIPGGGIPLYPLYQTPKEAGLCSPAVVNDVVFVTTNKLAIYAFQASTGQRLWSDTSANPGGDVTPFWAMGPAIYGEYVVVGAGRPGGQATDPGDGFLSIYTLQPPSYSGGGDGGGPRHGPPHLQTLSKRYFFSL